MANRLKLQSELEELLGSRNVYYQPPESLKIIYPAIIYSKRKPDIKRADNKIYALTNCYEIIVVSKTPDNPVIDKLLELPMCEWDRGYKSENLNHDVFTLYY